MSESERPERVAPVRRPAVQQAVEPEQEGECVQALEAFEAEAEPAAELRARVADACPCYGEEDYGEFLLCWGWRPFECEEFPYHPQCAPVEFTVPSDPDT